MAKSSKYNMLIIGIAGGTGCGKTTVVNQLLEQLPESEVEVISQDAYYKDTSNLSYKERVNINFDHPNSIDFKLLTTHIKALRQQKPVHQPVYSFVKHNRTGTTVLTQPKKVILIEGILILAHPELRDLLDVKIFIQTDSDERLLRRIKRDIADRGRTLEEIISRYQTTLKPMHRQFIEPSKTFADLIIPNNTYNAVAVDMLCTIINENL
jgi:uridine kinase